MSVWRHQKGDTCVKRECPARMKTVDVLVVAFGSMRGGGLARNTMHKHLLLPLNADLAVLQAYGETAHPRATHVWRVQEHDNWAGLVDNILPSDWRKKVDLTPNLWGGVDSTPGSGAIIFALRSVVLRYLDAVSERGYRTVVLTRFDYVYACDHPVSSADRGRVYTMDGEGYGGVTDRHTVFHMKDRHRVLPILRWLYDKPRLSFSNPEGALKRFYEDQNVSMASMPRVAFALKAANDTSRWSSGVSECGTFGWIKYVTEHESSVKACGHDPCSRTRRAEQLQMSVE